MPANKFAGGQNEFVTQFATVADKPKDWEAIGVLLHATGAVAAEGQPAVISYNAQRNAPVAGVAVNSMVPAVPALKTNHPGLAGVDEKQVGCGAVPPVDIEGQVKSVLSQIRVAVAQVKPELTLPADELMQALKSPSICSEVTLKYTCAPAVELKVTLAFPLALAEVLQVKNALEQFPFSTVIETI